MLALFSFIFITTIDGQCPTPSGDNTVNVAGPTSCPGGVGPLTLSGAGNGGDLDCGGVSYSSCSEFIFTMPSGSEGACVTITGNISGQGNNDVLYCDGSTCSLVSSDTADLSVSQPTSGSSTVSVYLCKNGNDVINQVYFNVQSCCELASDCPSDLGSVSCAGPLPAFAVDASALSVSATNILDGSDCLAGLALEIKDAFDSPDPVDPQALACAGPSDIVVTRTYIIGTASADDCIADITCTQNYTIVPDCCCSFDVSCPIANDLGTYDCLSIGDLPDCPTSVTSLAAFPYGIFINDSCGTPIIECVDSEEVDLCTTAPMTITRTITIIDDLNDNGLLDQDEESTICEFIYTIIPPTEIAVTGPADLTVDACDYADQSLLTSAYNDWLSQFVIINEGCGVLASTPLPNGPILCQAFSEEVNFMASDLCNSDSHTATFTVNLPEDITISCPDDMMIDASCQSQDAIDATYAAWLGQFSGGGGCNGIGSFAMEPGAPDKCGGVSTVVYQVEESGLPNCAPAQVCTGEFIVISEPSVAVFCPVDPMISSCSADIESAYQAWLDGFTTNAVCGITTNISDALNFAEVDMQIGCGGSITFTYEAMSLSDAGMVCSTDQCTATFTIVAPDPISMTCPDDMIIDVCNTQADIDAEFASWLGEFSGNGGCNATGNFSVIDGTTDNQLIAPDLCGGFVTVVWTVDDLGPGSNCTESETCTRTFSVTTNTAPIINFADPSLFVNNTMQVPCVATAGDDEDAEFVLPGNPEFYVEVEDDCNYTLDFVENEVEDGDCETDGFFKRFSCTFTATDDCGNVTTLQFFVEIVDTTPPVFQNLSDQEFYVDCGYEIPEVDPIVTDECLCVHLDKNVEIKTDGLNCNQDNFHRITWTAEDHCGNISIVTHTYYYEDMNAPEVTLNENYDFSEPICISDLESGAFITTLDNCDEEIGIDIQYQILEELCPTTSVVNSTILAFDACGNIDQYDFEVIIFDENYYVDPNELFYFTNPIYPGAKNYALINVDCNTIENLNLSPLDLATDPSCGYTPYFILETDIVFNSQGSVLHAEWTAYNDCSIIGIFSLFFQINDSEPPHIVNFDPSIKIECGDPLPEIIGEDNCSDFEIEESRDTISIACPGYKSIIRTITLTDLMGNDTTYTQTVDVARGNVLDSHLESYLCGSGNINSMFVIDACDATKYPLMFVGLDTISNGAECPPIIRYHYTAELACHESYAFTQHFIMDDMTPPEVKFNNPLLPSLLDQQNTVQQGYSIESLYGSINGGSVSGIDGCMSLNSVFSIDTTLLDCGTTGFTSKIEYTWVLTDICGNTTDVKLPIFIEDTEAPVVLSAPGDITIYCPDVIDHQIPEIYADDHGPFDNSYQQATSFDSSGNLVITDQFTLTDNCGNVGYYERSVTYDVSVPMISINGPSQINCNTYNPYSVTIDGPADLYNIDWSTNNASCTILGDGSQNVNILAGFTQFTIQVTVTDRNGCSSTAIKTVTCEKKKFESINALLNSDQNEIFDNIDVARNAESMEVSIFPNPAFDKIYLKTEINSENPITVIITDLSGTTVSAKQIINSESDIDISRLPQGVYHIIIRTDKDEIRKRIIKL